MIDDTYEPLRLPGSPSKTHVNYLRLEDALNALGRQDFATNWGRLPGWSQMPFRWRSKSREYVQHKLYLSRHQACLKIIPVELELTKAEKKACIDLYRKVRAIIRDALEREELKAEAMHYVTGEVTLITAPGIWRKQVWQIFFAGRVVIYQSDEVHRLADVVIKREEFEDWLASRAKETSIKILEKIGSTIFEHSQQYNYVISRQEAEKLVMQIASECGRKISVRQFKKYVWEPSGAKAGRRTKAMQTRYEECAPNLRTCLVTVLGGASQT